MARTAKKARPAAPSSRQAAIDAWGADALSRALRRGTVEEKRAILTHAGILGRDGKLAPKYRNWGSKATRTPEEN